LIGVSVGPYRIVGKLGAGGMGEVFLGHDPRLQRRVALKCLTRSEHQASEVHARIMREARAAARLTHPNIAAIYDVVEHDGRLFIVMEYVEGENLAELLARERLPMDRVRSIGCQLASALAAAHAYGVVHRDLKPANIQVTNDGSIKVLDFGVARLSAAHASSADAPTSTVALEQTLPGNPGTPPYMSPEQLLEKSVDARSDVYSAGVILFEMATGRRPYQERAAIAVALAMSTTAAPQARSINPEVPDDLNETIARALERDPARRIASAIDLERALRSPTERMPSHRLRSRTAYLIVSTAAIAAVAGIVLMTRPSVAARAAVIAVLPVENPTAEPRGESYGAGLASVVSENFASIAGVTVLSRASTAMFATRRNDVQALHRELGADYVLDLSVASMTPTPQVVVRLRTPVENSAVWERTLSGDALAVEKAVLEELGRQLEERGALPRRLTRADWARITRLPTDHAEALEQYAEARALLDRPRVAGNGARAAALLERAVAVDPRFVLAYAALGDAYWDVYQTDKNPAMVGKATDAIMTAIRLDPERAAVYYSLGNMQFLTGRSDAATASLKRSIALRPDSDETHRLLGEVLADRGETDAGIAQLREAIQIRPQYWRHYMTLGLVYYRAGRYREALVPYRRASELQPNEPSTFANLGTVYHRLGEVAQAIGNYEHAVRLGPSASAYANLALAYYRANRLDDARRAYEESLAANPKSVLNHRNLGDVYMRLRQAPKARDEYEQAIAIGNELVAVNPRDARTIALVALCEAKLGHGAAAERHAAEARALAASDREILQRSAEVHALLGKSAAALTDLEAALAAGYPRQDARDDDELTTLRKLPAFSALIADRP